MGKDICGKPTLDGGVCHNGPGCTINHSGPRAVTSIAGRADASAAAASAADSATDPARLTQRGQIDDANFAGANLAGQRLGSGTRVFRSSFDEADMRQVNMHGDATFMHSSFQGADMQRGQLGGIHIGCDYSDANLKGVQWGTGGGPLAGNFAGADLSKSTGSRTSFIDCSFDDANFEGASLDAGWHGADLSKAKNFDKARSISGSYDEDTKWPPGYDPTKNKNLEFRPMDPRSRAVRTEMVKRSAEGKYSPWDSYDNVA